MLRPWWQSPGFLAGGGVGAIVVIVLVIVLVAHLLTPAPISLGPVPASVLASVTDPSPDVYSQVGTGGQPGDMIRINNTSTLDGSSGRPEVVFVGGEYCPYCAAERWSMVVALSRFGTFANLQEMASTPDDVYPNTHSFTFAGSTYSSQYVDFVATEAWDRNDNPFQPMSSQVSQIYQTYDQPPYAASSGVPFLDIGNRFTIYQVQYSPAILQGLTWQQIAGDLSDPSNPVTQAIVGNANYLTAAICITTGGQPSGVCSTSVIQGIEKTLEAEQAVGS